MNLQEAYNLIDNVCRQVSLSRDGHIQLQQALEAIKEELDKKDEPKKSSKTE